MQTNLMSALVLMTAGDVMAQGLEHHHIGDTIVDGNTDQVVETDCKQEIAPRGRRMSLRKYGTHDPIEVYVGSKNNGKKDVHLVVAGDKEIDAKPSLPDVFSRIQNEIAFFDPFRTATMVTWNVVFTTPFFLYLYRVCDRIFVPPTFWTVSARVLVTLFVSVPVNALFFTYGTCVHHTAEWYGLRQDLKLAMVNVGFDETVAKDALRTITQFDWPMMWSKVQLKVESELVDTIKKSATVWVPINAVNFAVVPPHLRPLWMMFFSVFWNCYLSIVQHRDLVLPMRIHD
jgi:hypothetical protein